MSSKLYLGCESETDPEAAHCLLCPAQVPTVVPEARRALEQGCAVVIGLQTTGEAAADSMGLEPGQSCGSVSTTKQMLWHFVATHFPLKRETQKNGMLAVPLQ